MKKTIISVLIGLCSSSVAFAADLDAVTVNKALADAKKYNDADASWMYSGEHNNLVYRDVSLLTPTVKINRDGPITSLPIAHQSDLAKLKVAALENRSIEELFENMHFDQFTVYSKGSLVLEKYRDGFDGNTQHLMQSVTKTMTAMVFLGMAGDGLVDIEKQVTDYVPELKGTFYDGATLRNVLDMSVGLSNGDNYGAHDNLNTQVKAMQAATGYAEFAPDREDIDFIEYMKQYNTEGKRMMQHGDTAWFYNSQNTDLLALVMERVGNKKWASLFQDYVYSKAGPNNDATMIYSLAGYGGFDGGFSVSPRDMIRIVLAHTKGELKDGYFMKDTFQPADKITESRIGGEKVAHPEILEFAKLANDVLNITHYRNQTYLGTNPLNGNRLYYALGVYGQCVVWSPDSDFIMVTTGSYNPSSMKSNIAALFAAQSIEAELSK